MVRVELIIGNFLGGLVNSTGAVAELAQRVNMECRDVWFLRLWR